jgi:hypothetical protein
MNDIATKIVTIPRKFHSLGNMSEIALLEATGYFELHDQVSESDIRNALARDPECVQEWMQESEDQRCPAAWYFVLNEEGCYEVGYFDLKSDPNITNRVQYQNAIDACAAFIMHNIEDMRLYRLQEQQRRQQRRQRQQQQAKERKQREGKRGQI